MSGLIQRVWTRTAMAAAAGAAGVGFKGKATTAKLRTVGDKLADGRISIFDVMTRAQVDEVVNSESPKTDLTWAFQEVIAYLQTKSRGYSSPRFTVEVPRGKYMILDDAGIKIDFNVNLLQMGFVALEGANLIGNGKNSIFDFVNGGSRNLFQGLTFEKATTGIRWRTNNRDQCRLMVEDCISGGDIDTWIDTVSYSESRSSEVNINNCLVSASRVAVRSFVDQMTVQNTRVYGKPGSYDAAFYLSGDGVVTLDKLLLIPNAEQVETPSKSRWIDFVSDPDECTPGDRSLKTLVLSGVRQSLESARPLIWTFDSCDAKPSGNNQVSSITIQDSPCLGTGGHPLVTYKEGYPGSVNLRNAKVLAAPYIVAVDPLNTSAPVPSRPGAVTSHVIMIDEATRLSQSNGNNASALLDPALTPFLIDSTTQTSKYGTSIPEDVNYRKRCVSGGSGRVKASFKIFFDSENAAHNRDLLSFMLITVSDAFAAPAAGRAMYHGLVSLVAANQGGVDIKALSVAGLQDAKGGVGFGASSAPYVFFGTGNTGDQTIASVSKTGTEDTITVAFDGNNADVCWVYLIPLAGIRGNQWDKQQYGNW